MGVFLLLFGLFLVLLAFFFLFGERLPLKFLGRLPGDIRIEKPRFRFYVPLTTSILLSLLLTIIVNIFWRR